MTGFLGWELAVPIYLVCLLHYSPDNLPSIARRIVYRIYFSLNLSSNSASGLGTERFTRGISDTSGTTSTASYTRCPKKYISSLPNSCCASKSDWRRHKNDGNASRDNDRFGYTHDGTLNLLCHRTVNGPLFLQRFENPHSRRPCFSCGQTSKMLMSNVCHAPLLTLKCGNQYVQTQFNPSWWKKKFNPSWWKKKCSTYFTMKVKTWPQ